MKFYFYLWLSGLPPLYPFPLAAIPLDSKQEAKSDSSVNPQLAVLQQHPHLISYQQFKMLQTKSHLVMRYVFILPLKYGSTSVLVTEIHPNFPNHPNRRRTSLRYQGLHYERCGPIIRIPSSHYPSSC